MERLQKVLAQAGVASRRAAEEIIREGRVRVNGQIVRELGTKVGASDRVAVDDHAISTSPQRQLYLILNKPRGYISDTDDTASRPSALELVPADERIYPAGRLDWNSEGLLLLTNDGELAFRLTHPRFEHQKEYRVLVVGQPDRRAMEQWERGISSEDEWLRADKVDLAGKHQPFGNARAGETWLRFLLHEGKKRQIRRMCFALGFPVRRLIRVRIGPVELGDLASGKWRALTRAELKELRESLEQPRPRPARAAGRRGGTAEPGGRGGGRPRSRGPAIGAKR